MGSTVDQLRRELAEMREVMERQRARVEQQQARIEQLEAAAPDRPAGAHRSRRQMLKLAGATLAGAAAGAAGLAGGATARADTGQALVLGLNRDDPPLTVENRADKATQLNYLGAAQVGTGFLAQAGAFWTPISSGFPSALGGWTDLAIMPNGVYGLTNAPKGVGVVAHNLRMSPSPDDNAPGLHAESLWGYAAEFFIQANGKAQIFVKPSASSGAPAPAGHQNGELYVDKDGILYYFLGGSFRPVLGQTTMLAAPIRLLETRPFFEDPSSGQTKPHRPLSNGEIFDLPITGQVMGGQSVPAAAKAVIGNITVTNPVAPGGYLTLFPYGAPLPATSSINYLPGQTVANGVIVGLSGAGHLALYASAQTDAIFDAAGYIM